jgi:hypothetical protein
MVAKRSNQEVDEAALAEMNAAAKAKNAVAAAVDAEAEVEGEDPGAAALVAKKAKKAVAAAVEAEAEVHEEDPEAFALAAKKAAKDAKRAAAAAAAEAEAAAPVAAAVEAEAEVEEEDLEAAALAAKKAAKKAKKAAAAAAVEAEAAALAAAKKAAAIAAAAKDVKMLAEGPRKRRRSADLAATGSEKAEADEAPPRRRRLSAAADAEIPTHWAVGVSVDSCNRVYWLPDGWTHGLKTTRSGMRKCFVDPAGKLHFHKAGIEKALGRKFPPNPKDAAKDAPTIPPPGHWPSGISAHAGPRLPWLPSAFGQGIKLRDGKKVNVFVGPEGTVYYHKAVVLKRNAKLPVAISGPTGEEVD